MLNYKITTALLLILIGQQNVQGFFAITRHESERLGHDASKIVRKHVEANIELVILKPLMIDPETLELKVKETNRLSKRMMRKPYHQRNSARKSGYIMHPQGRNGLKLRPCRSFSWRFRSCWSVNSAHDKIKLTRTKSRKNNCGPL